MADVLKSFGVQWPLLVASFINFFILLFLMQKFLYKPILKVLDERKEKIEESLRQAAWIEEEKKKIEEKVKASLKLANQQAIKTIEQAKVAAEKVKADIIEEAHKQSEQVIEKAKAEIKQEQEEAVKMIKKEAAGLVSDSLKKIMTDKAGDETDEKMIKEVLDKVDG